MPGIHNNLQEIHAMLHYMYVVYGLLALQLLPMPGFPQVGSGLEWQKQLESIGKHLHA